MRCRAPGGWGIYTGRAKSLGEDALRVRARSLFRRGEVALLGDVAYLEQSRGDVARGHGGEGLRRD